MNKYTRKRKVFLNKEKKIFKAGKGKSILKIFKNFKLL